jgi:hypothetical protein
MDANDLRPLRKASDDYQETQRLKANLKKLQQQRKAILSFRR